MAWWQGVVEGAAEERTAEVKADREDGQSGPVSQRRASRSSGRASPGRSKSPRRPSLQRSRSRSPGWDSPRRASPGRSRSPAWANSRQASPGSARRSEEKPGQQQQQQASRNKQVKGKKKKKAATAGGSKAKAAARSAAPVPKLRAAAGGATAKRRRQSAGDQWESAGDQWDVLVRKMNAMRQTDARFNADWQEHCKRGPRPGYHDPRKYDCAFLKDFIDEYEAGGRGGGGGACGGGWEGGRGGGRHRGDGGGGRNCDQDDDEGRPRGRGGREAAWDEAGGSSASGDRGGGDSERCRFTPRSFRDGGGEEESGGAEVGRSLSPSAPRARSREGSGRWDADGADSWRQGGDWSDSGSWRQGRWGSDSQWGDESTTRERSCRRQGGGGGRKPRHRGGDGAENPCVRLENLPTDYTHPMLVDLHQAMGLDAATLESSKIYWEDAEDRVGEAGAVCPAMLRYTDRESAEAAARELDGQPVKDKLRRVHTLRANVRTSQGPSAIEPSIYVSDVPVEYTEDTLRKMHVDCGLDVSKLTAIKQLPVRDPTGETHCCIFRYRDAAACRLATDAIQGRVVRTASGAQKFLGARPAKPAQWMVKRGGAEVEADGWHDRRDVETDGDGGGGGSGRGSCGASIELKSDHPSDVKEFMEKWNLALDAGTVNMLSHLPSGIREGVFERFAPPKDDTSESVVVTLNKLVRAVQSTLKEGVPLVGRVRSWLEEKQFGFITPDGSCKDVFVHRSNLTDGSKLQPGSQVTFEVLWHSGTERYNVTKCTGAIGEKPALSPFHPVVPKLANIVRPIAVPPKNARPVAVPPRGLAPAAFVSNALALQSIVLPPMPIVQMQPGTLYLAQVNNWRPDRGTGTLKPLDNGPEILVNASAVSYGASLKNGVWVSFNTQWDATGSAYIASNCEVVDGGPGTNLSLELSAFARRLHLNRAAIAIMASLPADLQNKIIEVFDPNLGLGSAEDLASKLRRFARCVQQQSMESAGSPGVAQPSRALWSFAQRWELGGSIVAWLSRETPDVQSKTFQEFRPKFGERGPTKEGVVGGLRALVRQIASQKDRVAVVSTLPLLEPSKELADFAQKWALGTASVVWLCRLPNDVQKSLIQRFHEDNANSATSVTNSVDAICAESDKLVVSDLPLTATEDTVRKIVGDYGMVTMCKMLPNGGKPTRSALVCVSDPRQAKLCIEGLNDVLGLLEGTMGPLRVRPVNPRPAHASATLMVVGLPQGGTEALINKVFGEMGTVVSAKVLTPPHGRIDRSGLVRMADIEEAEACIEGLNKTFLPGLAFPLEVRYAEKTELGHDFAVRDFVRTKLGHTPVEGGSTEIDSLEDEVVTLNGSVKFWHKDKNFGFIAPDGGGEDVFVHDSQLPKSLRMAEGKTLAVGTPVSFQLEWDPQRKNFKALACSVRSKPTHEQHPGAGRNSAAGTGGDLRVTGLPGNSTLDNVRRFFGAYGTVVQCSLLPDHGRLEKVALVKMADKAQAAKAMEAIQHGVLGAGAAGWSKGSMKGGGRPQLRVCWDDVRGGGRGVLPGGAKGAAVAAAALAGVVAAAGFKGVGRGAVRPPFLPGGKGAAAWPATPRFPPRPAAPVGGATSSSVPDERPVPQEPAPPAAAFVGEGDDQAVAVGGESDPAAAEAATADLGGEPFPPIPPMPWEDPAGLDMTPSDFRFPGGEAALHQVGEEEEEEGEERRRVLSLIGEADPLANLAATPADADANPVAWAAEEWPAWLRSRPEDAEEEAGLMMAADSPGIRSVFVPSQPWPAQSAVAPPPAAAAAGPPPAAAPPWADDDWLPAEDDEEPADQQDDGLGGQEEWSARHLYDEAGAAAQHPPLYGSESAREPIDAEDI